MKAPFFQSGERVGKEYATDKSVLNTCVLIVAIRKQLDVPLLRTQIHPDLSHVIECFRVESTELL